MMDLTVQRECRACSGSHRAECACFGIVLSNIERFLLAREAGS